MESSHNIHYIIHQYRIELKTMAEAVAETSASDRFRLLCRINKLKQLLMLMEEVDHSIEQLMRKASSLSVGNK